MTAEPARTDAPSPAPANPGLERALKIIVAALGVMIIAGLAAVVWRIVGLASSPSAGKAPVSPAAATLSLPAGAVAAAQLPRGATVKSVSLDGDRMAIYYESPEGQGICVVEIASGRIIANVRLTSPAD